MTKREQYGLTFYKAVNFDGKKINKCGKDNVDSYSPLTIIGRMDISEIKCLVAELTNAISLQEYEQFFSSDGVESDEVELAYPNISINGLTISMQDMLDLLNEWLAFISPNASSGVHAGIRK